MDDHDLARLAASPLFAGADLPELGSFFRRQKTRIQVFGPGSVVLLAGCAYEELRIVLEGRAEAEMASGGGRSVVVEEFSPPDAIATAVLFSPGHILPVSVLARTELRLAGLPRPVLLAAASAFPSVLEALLGDMGGRLALLAEKYRAVSFTTLRERLADWLLRKAGRHPSSQKGGKAMLSLHLPDSKERLSASFGVARPSLSREFAWLEEKGLIVMRGRDIDILDEAGLEKIRASGAEG